ncbi:hypothetical protein LEMLEM_LOCUS17477 [Lemmus lemmus]
MVLDSVKLEFQESLNPDMSSVLLLATQNSTYHQQETIEKGTLWEKKPNATTMAYTCAILLSVDW